MPEQELGCLATSCGRHSRWCCRHPMPAMTGESGEEEKIDIVDENSVVVEIERKRFYCDTRTLLSDP